MTERNDCNLPESDIFVEKITATFLQGRNLVLAVTFAVLVAMGLMARPATADDLGATWNPNLLAPAVWSISPSQFISTPSNWDVDDIVILDPGNLPAGADLLLPPEVLDALDAAEESTTISLAYPSHVPLFNAYYSADIGSNGAADVTLNGLLAVSLDQLSLNNGSSLTIPESSDLI